MRLDAVTATACAIALSVGLTSFSSALPDSDTDSDGVYDDYDNCVDIANPSQRDDNEDGYGHVCDPDIDDDCIIGLGDHGLVLANWGASGPPWTSSDVASVDIDESDMVGIIDLGKVGDHWGETPGPSGLACRQDCSGDGPYPPPPTGCLGGNPLPQPLPPTGLPQGGCMRR
jgi:hypothetical protein